MLLLDVADETILMTDTCASMTTIGARTTPTTTATRSQRVSTVPLPREGGGVPQCHCCGTLCPSEQLRRVSLVVSLRLISDRLKREERRREELYRQYYEEIKRRFDAERPVDCSVIVVNKQTK